MHHRLAMWMAIKWKWTHRMLIWLDDKLGYGKRNPLKKWWLDLETKDGHVVRPAGVNERDLNLGRADTKDEEKRAMYDYGTLPGPGAPPKSPPDRVKGLEDRARAAEELRKLKERIGA
ncbi:MAG: hypothetical protein KIT16_02170, partial [Rhodospirillaceae bacterium]|nr:hypothetical protein [Rhodospirillaceae bacterium]